METLGTSKGVKTAGHGLALVEAKRHIGNDNIVVLRFEDGEVAYRISREPHENLPALRFGNGDLEQLSLDTDSPLARALVGKVVGDGFEFLQPSSSITSAKFPVKGTVIALVN